MIQSGANLIRALSDSAKSWSAYFSKYVASTPTAGYWYDYTTLAGDPVANPYSGASLQGQQLTDASQGAIRHGGNVSPAVKRLVAASLCSVSGGNLFLICDFLLYYPGISLNTTSQQNLSNPVSLPRYSSGEGVRMYLLTRTAAGATSANLSVSYTNSEGEPGRQLPVSVSLTPSSPVGHIIHSAAGAGKHGPFLPLADGDKGVRSVQWVKLNKAMGAGTAALVLVRPLVALPFTRGYGLVERNCARDWPQMPVIHDGAYLGLLAFITSLTYRTMLTGMMQFVWD